MLSALLTAVVFAATPEAGQPPPVMTQALVALATLTPWLSSPDAFRDPGNFAEIAGSLETLARLRHSFLRGPGASPAGVARLFGDQAAWARTDFLAGNTELARNRVRGLAPLCLGCHLRQPSREFDDAQRVVEHLKLPPLQQAEFFAVTRQFDRALALWLVELALPVRLETEQLEQLEGLRQALGVAVRVRDDPKLAQRLLARQLTRTGLPGFARRELEAWQKDAVAWEKDRFGLAYQTPATLITRARLLVESTDAAKSAMPSPLRFVALLRAASYLDELMRQAPEGPFRAEALYLLGVVHPSVSDDPLWQLEWMYLEACIRENAGMPPARLCADRLKERTWFIWRSGADMPAATRAALGELMWTASHRPGE